MDCPVEVTLQPHELRWLLDIAHRRNDGKSREQSRHVLVAEFGDLAIDLLGLKGEYIVARLYGVPFDAEGYGSCGDSGVDIRTPTPGAVKTNHRRGGYLLLERWRDVARVEIMHLVDGNCAPPTQCGCSIMNTGVPERWRYCGWISVARFRSESECANWGLGPRRFVRQSQLERKLHDDANVVTV